MSDQFENSFSALETDVDASTPTSSSKKRDLSDRMDDQPESWDLMSKKQKKKAKGRASCGLDAPLEAYFAVFGSDAAPEVEMNFKEHSKKHRSTSLHFKDLTNFLLSVELIAPTPIWIRLKNRPLVSNIVCLVLEGIGEYVFQKNLASLSNIVKYFSPLAPLHGNGTGDRAYPPINVLLSAPVQQLKGGGLSGGERKLSGAQKRGMRKSNSNQVFSASGVTQVEGAANNSMSREQLSFELSKYVLSTDLLQDNRFQIEKPDDSWKETMPPGEDSSESPQAFGLDCEMVMTTEGSELARVTLVDFFTKEVVLDMFVKPKNRITDYLTVWSGITEDNMGTCSNRLIDAQKRFVSLVCSNAILIGHSLENDLNSMKVIHRNVIDTSVVFPHPSGPPMKQQLKRLCHHLLKLDIQNSKTGHSSEEDAVAVVELMRKKATLGGSFGGSGTVDLFTLYSSWDKTGMLIDRLYITKNYQKAITIDVSSDSEMVAKVVENLGTNQPSRSSLPHFTLGHFWDADDWFGKDVLIEKEKLWNGMEKRKKAIEGGDDDSNFSDNDSGSDDSSSSDSDASSDNSSNDRTTSESDNDSDDEDEEVGQKKQKKESKLDNSNPRISQERNTVPLEHVLEETNLGIASIVESLPRTTMIVLVGCGSVRRVQSLKSVQASFAPIWSEQDAFLLTDAASKAHRGFVCVGFGKS